MKLTLIYSNKGDTM